MLENYSINELEALAFLTHVAEYAGQYYWYVTNEGETIVRSYLPPEVCEQHVVTNLALEMKKENLYNFVALFTDENRPVFYRVNRYLGFREEKRGHIFHPIEVDTLVQVRIFADSLRLTDYFSGLFVRN